MIFIKKLLRLYIYCINFSAGKDNPIGMYNFSPSEENIFSKAFHLFSLGKDKMQRGLVQVFQSFQQSGFNTAIFSNVEIRNKVLFKFDKVLLNTALIANQLVIRALSGSMIELAANNATPKFAEDDPPFLFEENLTSSLVGFEKKDHILISDLEKYITTYGAENVFGNLVLDPSFRNSFLTQVATLLNDKKKGKHGTRVLYEGVPGTGKTASVKKIAKLAGYNLYITSAGRLMRYPIEYVSKELNRVMQECRKPGNLLFIDEIELLLSDRSNKLSEGLDDDSKKVMHILDTLNTEFLKNSGDLQSSIFGATNIISNIDKAYDRRFPWKVIVNSPKKAQRIQIFYHYIKKNDINICDSTIAKTTALFAKNSKGMSGSDIETLCFNLKPQNKLQVISIKDLVCALKEDKEKKLLAGIIKAEDILYRGLGNIKAAEFVKHITGGDIIIKKLEEKSLKNKQDSEMYQRMVKREVGSIGRMKVSPITKNKQKEYSEYSGVKYDKKKIFRKKVLNPVAQETILDKKLERMNLNRKSTVIKKPKKALKINDSIFSKNKKY